MAGTGIGTFSDRLRDAVRGGGPFDADPRIQGFASGLYTDPNGAAVNGAPDQQRARLLLHHDQIKVGLAGNLRDYTFVNRDGQTVKGSQVDYNGQPAGYAAEPDETITYVDAHDNETLFDVLQYKLPASTSMADLVRMNTLALATTALAQSPSFWHAGTDLLRSKSLDRNSYNSGDWFNRIDWSARESTLGSGLPPREDNESKWEFMRPLLENPSMKPGAADLRAARERAGELLRIRFSSPLFRLGDAEQIQRRVSFPTGGPSQTPGVIVMAIDGRSEGVVVVFNATPEATTQTVASLAGRRYRLHASRRTAATRSCSARPTRRAPARSRSRPARSRCSRRSSESAAATEHGRDRLEQDRQVEPDRPALEVEEVEPHEVVEVELRAARDLPQPGQPRQHEVALLVPVLELVEVALRQRARADERHPALDDVEQLRQLVERVAPQEPADAASGAGRGGS